MKSSSSVSLRPAVSIQLFPILSRYSGKNLSGLLNNTVLKASVNHRKIIAKSINNLIFVFNWQIVFIEFIISIYRTLAYRKLRK